MKTDKQERVTREHYAQLREQITREFGNEALNELILKSNAISLGVAVQIYPEKTMHQCIEMEERYYSRKLRSLRDLVYYMRIKNRRYNIHTTINSNYSNKNIID